MQTFSTVLLASLLVAHGARAQVLAPMNDIQFPSSSSASDPLQFAGANSPWFVGPNVFGISNEVPKGCTVQQAAYIVRHGSRFPDPGSYNSWVSIAERIQAAVQENNLTATDSLSFIPNWSPVLSNPTLQLSQESITGWKELHDLGYQLRARYPDFYEDGNPFLVWANQYASPINSSRVVQSAQAFLQGYLYVFAQTYGTVVSVNSTGSPDALGRSLGPSDLCPAFTNNPGNNVTDWDNVWVPPTLKRINSMIKGNLTFSESDILFFPYLCAYESQILGRLSPWCSVFTNDELRSYQYSQDLSYFYGDGPGSSGPAQKVFLPFLDGLMSLFMEGPGQQGKGLNGSTFTLPDLIMSFLNDGQIAQMTAAMGIFDTEGNLPIDHIPEHYLYNVAHFITMRGTVAFEVLNCENSAPNQTYIRILFNDVVYPVANCQNGPGHSCLLSEYAAYIHSKNSAAGEFKDYCNVTAANAATKINGAGFFTDLTLDYLTFVKPFFE
ncbi:hypothetical protein OIDMADRAFT_128149 [Oidiodendron maius Zn]|uniref:3-phytase n=1 Tax=Oidiodendron maius (strain Zn) TaxID=913774 RepID=A0A0C3D8J2_OIDMZ|nr:hypothetical protein OIDMADRAFT_128149 [Oidiodendron maius Zn]